MRARQAPNRADHGIWDNACRKIVKFTANRSKVSREDRGLAFIGRLGLKRSLCLALLCLDSAYAATWQTNGTATNVQYTHDNLAHDGDTITLPSGIFNWTQRVNITKGITIRGANTCSGTGTANPTCSDATKIIDNTPRTGSPGIFKVDLVSPKSFRLTGVSFVPGSTTTFSGANGAFMLNGSGNAPVTVRVDNCHFAQLYQGKIIYPSGWIYGVADHNLIQCRSGSFSFEIWNGASYGGSTQYNGNGAFADYPWFGTNKFFFIETNTIVNAGAQETTNATIDSYFGGRWVARHNYFINTTPSTHGTEGGSFRGQRACEIYDNIFDLRFVNNGIGQRSGTSLIHDNRFIGIEPASDQLCSLDNYRETPARVGPSQVWGIADGTSRWDLNDNGSGNPVPFGQPGFTFASGTASGGTVSSSTATMTDATKNWATNQWVGYSITNITCSTCGVAPIGSYIVSNTNNTITYNYYSATDTAGHLKFVAGDRYAIHRVLVMMDQHGRGRGDQITGQSQPINSTTGTASWPHQALEPCYSWNNLFTPNGHVLSYRVKPGQPTVKAGIDFFNLGGGFPADITPQAVSSKYTAALNGVQYTGTFTYPHPLVSGGPTPTTSSPTVTTNPATNIASFAAALNGSVNPGGSTTTVYFQWGTTTSYGHTAPMQTQTGNTSRPITANISGLSASQLYHFRIVATNGGGTSFGSDRTFTTLSATGPPVVTTNPATNIASFAAVLNGSLDPHGLTTTVYFQWGTTTSYGHTTSTQTQTGNTYRNITANISGLSASQLYHFRIVATNGGGTSFGSDRTFTTLSATGPPVVTTNPATNVTTSSAALNGSLDPHGLTTTVYFQWGTTTNYGHITPMQTQTGNTYRNITANISGLSASQLYHFRIVAINSAGTRMGIDRTFNTP
jgi:hypothetical protein